MSDRHRAQTVIQPSRPSQVMVADHIGIFNIRRSVLRRASGQSPENLESSVLKVETTVNSSQGIAAVEQNIQISDLFSETISDLDQGGYRKISTENERSHSELTILDDSIIQQPKEPLSLADEGPETCVSSTNEAVSRSKRSSKRRAKRLEFYRIPHGLFIQMHKAGVVKQMRDLGVSELNKQVLNQLGKEIKNNNEFTLEDMEIAILVEEIRNQPKDPEMDKLITEATMEISNYGKISRAPKYKYNRKEKAEKQALSKKKLGDIYNKRINLTKSKNLSCYHLAHYAGSDYLAEVTARYDRKVNQHHAIPAKYFSRIVYEVDHSGHSRAHWFAYLETGKAYHISVAQSQNSKRYNERTKSTQNIKQNSPSQQIETSKSTSQQEDIKN